MNTKKTKTKPIPNAGSPEAIEAGCKCPIFDNHHGKGYMGIEGVFVFSGGCELHSIELEEAEKEIDRRNNDETNNNK
jgi:hypothetical protein